ncbi:hypothetical protein CFP56_028602 [Quercus suber]|uniref:Uncharacterized protein n=1 Tax=Quercus suber TaxID=58331 RepID=A0AAW0JUV2_QUESU
MWDMYYEAYKKMFGKARLSIVIVRNPKRLTRLKAIGSKTSTELIRKYKDLGHPIDCIATK